MMVDVIYCRGGSKTAPHIAQMAGMKYGTHYKYTAYAPVYFLDAGIDPVWWPDYYACVRELQPSLAVVPDYYHPHELPRLLAQIDSIRSLDVIPLICPKFDGAVYDIPRDCRVAISVPAQEYAGFLPADNEVIDRDLHLLGGSPAQYLYIMRHRYQQSRVLSVDGNKFAYKAQMGQIWHAQQARWVQLPAGRASNYTLERVSAMQIVEYLNNPKSAIRDYQPSVQTCRSQPAKQLDLLPI
jgi:hypothetical protein